MKASKTHHGFRLVGNEDGASAKILTFNGIVLNGDEGTGIT